MNREPVDVPFRVINDGIPSAWRGKVRPDPTGLSDLHWLQQIAVLAIVIPALLGLKMLLHAIIR